MASVQDPTPWDEHQPQRRHRTIDVTTGAAGFEELMLPRWLLDGLAAAGFVRFTCDMHSTGHLHRILIVHIMGLCRHDGVHRHLLAGHRRCKPQPSRSAAWAPT